MAISKTNLAMAPSEACVRCLAENTDTAFAIRADLGGAISILRDAVELSTERASETLMAAMLKAGLSPGHPPKGELTYVVRLCVGCSETAGTPVADRDSDELPGYFGAGADGG
jgi:hypothetical protein